MNTEKIINELEGNAVLPLVSGSVFCCAFCGYESKANYPIDKGYFEPQEPIKNFWTKKHRMYICTSCLIKHNPHRCIHHPTKSILYIKYLTKGDKANMARLLH